MNMFSSVISLLLVSAATANKAHEVIVQPRIARIINAVQEDPDMDIACMTEVDELFGCLGMPCINCFIDMIEFFYESTTCESLQEDKHFCKDVEGCIKKCGKNDCTAPAIDLEDCAAKEYPDAEAEDDEFECPGLCEEAFEDRIVTLEVPAPTDVSSLATKNEAHDLIIQPRIARIINAVQEEPDMDLPCDDEVVGLLDCLGMPCILCFGGMISAFDENTTCESLMEDRHFCKEVTGCVKKCSKNDCTGPAMALENCAMEEAPDATADEEDECPGLCEELSDSNEITFGTYEIA